MGTSDLGIYIYQYILALYNRAILYLKAFIFALKAFVIQSSAIGKIKVKVFIAFYANKPILVRNTIDLERFKYYY